MKHRTAALAVLVAAVAVSSAAGGIGETIKLAPRNGSGVTGTATISSPGDTAAAAVRVKVRGLKPGAFVRIQLNTVSGKNTSASTVLIASARADAKGALVASGRVRYRGTAGDVLHDCRRRPRDLRRQRGEARRPRDHAGHRLTDEPRRPSLLLPPAASRLEPGRCHTRQQIADTKRTHQRRHARRLATHLRRLQHPDLQEKLCRR